MSGGGRVGHREYEEEEGEEEDNNVAGERGGKGADEETNA